MKIKFVLLITFFLLVGVCFLAYENPSVQDDMHMFEDNLSNEFGYEAEVENYTLLGSIALKIESYIMVVFNLISALISKFYNLL